MQDARGIDILIVKKNIVVHSDPSYIGDLSTVTWYQQLVHSLIYAMIET